MDLPPGLPNAAGHIRSGVPKVLAAGRLVCDARQGGRDEAEDWCRRLWRRRADCLLRRRLRSTHRRLPGQRLLPRALATLGRDARSQRVGVIAKFGDAELATLIAPRPLMIEHSRVPKVEEPLPVRPGRKKSGAVGRIETPDFARRRARVRGSTDWCRRISNCVSSFVAARIQHFLSSRKGWRRTQSSNRSGRLRKTRAARSTRAIASGGKCKSSNAMCNACCAKPIKPATNSS